MKARAALLLLFLLIISLNSASALPRVKGNIDCGDADRVIILSGGKANSVNLSNGAFLARAGRRGNYFAVVEDGEAQGVVVYGIKVGKRGYSVPLAQSAGVCSDSSARAVLGLKKPRAARGILLGGVSCDETNNIIYATRPKRAFADLRPEFLVPVDSNCAPLGTNLGMTGDISSSFFAAAAGDTDADGLEDADDMDDDGDGMPDAFDVDDDGDGVLDNDDEDSNQAQPAPGEEEERSFWVFSNFHLDMEDSINGNALEVTKEMIDDRLENNSGLAIQVFGDDEYDVELDCKGLSYCSIGGTGRGNEPYPDGIEFPEDVDDDNDGMGTIEPGSTGDFQLSTGADSDEIQAGDVFVQNVTDDSGNTFFVPGMLNFVFHTSPAAKQVITSEQTYDITYPVTSGDPGTSTNCFEVASSGDVEVTLTMWRPQRAGIESAGEAALMDMGNLKLITNIPNGPCTPNLSGMCSTNTAGPGVCPASSYSESDPNLEIDGDGLQDSLGDQEIDSSNTFTYTIDLTDCLNNASISWDAGDKLMVPLQMMNVYGDNATQNVCFIRKET